MRHQPGTACGPAALPSQPSQPSQPAVRLALPGQRDHGLRRLP